MTKFEEELFNKVPCKFELTTEAEYKKTTLINHFKNWHSDDEYQELFDKYSNLNDNYEKEVIRSSKLESQIIDLKSQLQQQALPVVPSFVAEWIEYVKGKDNNVTALLTDFDNMPEDVDQWLFLQSNDENINFIIRAWLDGYTVEKPQLFYLKNKIELEEVGSDLIGYLNLFLTNGGYLTNNINRAKKFTQSEIDSMETGSYEQIEVVE